MNRTFSESLRFPGVDKPARVVLKKRDAKNAFQDVWTTRVDPADKFIVRAGALAQAGPLIKLHESGDPATKLDLLILGDGYTARERAKFERDAKRLVATLLATSPFKERENDINVWGLVPASIDSGISQSVAAHLQAHADRHDVRHVRLRALRADRGEPRVPRHRRERAVRRRRDPDQQRDVRRRRHLRPVQHRRGRQRGRRTSSCTSSVITSRALPTSTTRRTWRICRRRRKSSRGSRTSRRCSIR